MLECFWVVKSERERQTATTLESKVDFNTAQFLCWLSVDLRVFRTEIIIMTIKVFPPATEKLYCMLTIWYVCVIDSNSQYDGAFRTQQILSPFALSISKIDWKKENIAEHFKTEAKHAY